jgi:hypothetical protein
MFMAHPKSAASFAHHETVQAGDGRLEMQGVPAAWAFQVVDDID